MTGCREEILDVINKFKQFTARVLSGVAAPNADSLIQGTPQERRNKAVAQFALALAFVLIAVWQSYLFGAFGILLVVAAVLYSVPFVIKGIHLWKSTISTAKNSKDKPFTSPATKRAKSGQSPSPATQAARRRQSTNPTTKGTNSEKPGSSSAKSAKQEKTVVSILRDLEQQGWRIESNLPIPQLGSVDAFLRSPKKNYFIVSVQSYHGEVFFDEGVLKRREGTKVYDFEKDFLKIVMEQALTLKDIKQLQLITPVLCFTDATLSIETVNNKARDVYVVKKEALVRKLVRLDNSL